MWTLSALASEARPLGGLIWRAVEHQYTISTRKIVDTDQEQAVLEDLLDAEAKPPKPAEAADFHYLLMTPFRHQPVKRHGSRFRAPGPGHGVYYAAEGVPTALAEFAYWRFRFFQASPETPLPRQQLPLTVFSAKYETPVGLDLTEPELVRDRVLWTAREDYAATQALAASAREIEVGVIRYESVRDPNHLANVAILSIEAFAERHPMKSQTWHLFLSAAEASFRRQHGIDRKSVV